MPVATTERAGWNFFKLTLKITFWSALACCQREQTALIISYWHQR